MRMNTYFCILYSDAQVQRAYEMVLNNVLLSMSTLENSVKIIMTQFLV